MSDLNDENTRSLVNHGHDRLSSFLSHFSRGGSWENWQPAQSAAYLELLKTDLIGLAGQVEARLQETYLSVESPQDFGT
jgi:hypothetical protein